MIVTTLVKPTGNFHLGNYVSIVKPIKELVKQDNIIFLGIADLHALNSLENLKDLNKNKNYMLRLLYNFFKEEIESKKVHLYIQSYVPWTSSIMNVLSTFCPIGYLERNHAMKSIDGKKQCVSSGLFLYPLLMACDILQFNANLVPVGIDQLQHLEIAKKIAKNFNNFSKYFEFKIPEAYVLEDVVLPGIDGRKMSKSYKNVIGFFDSLETIKKKIFSISTNSKNVGEPKSPTESNICKIFESLAPKQEFNALVHDMSNGIGWGEIKGRTYELVKSIIEPIQFEILNMNTIDKKNMSMQVNKACTYVSLLAQETYEKIMEEMLNASK